MSKNNNTKNESINILNDISSTGDTKTNDFDLIADKLPALSTIRTQIRSANNLIKAGHTLSQRIEFDRLKIALNLIQFGETVGFENLKMEDVENPKDPPSYTQDQQLKWDLLHDALYAMDEIQSSTQKQDNTNDCFDEIDVFIPNEFKSNIEPEPYKEPIKEETTTSSANIPNGIVDILKDKTVKKRIRYENFKSTIGMLNMYISNGYFVVDLSGKWMHSKSVLGSLNKDNIREALQKVLNLQVVSFNLDKFIKHAQVFVCDVCLDLALDSKQQVERYIDGLSSFFPISTNRFNIAKYKRHGLMLKPKAQNGGFSLIVYSKGEELDCSVKRSSKATRYTIGIGAEGEKLAQRTLRFEAKFYKLKDARKYLGISKDENCVLSLNEVLNSKTPTILLMFELFSGQANVLLEHLEWLHDLVIKPDELTLKEIFLAERFIQILKENNFDLAIVRSHIKTEYINVSDTELEEFNRLSNQKRNVLNYLVYRKPKSITIMLDILNRIQRYYQIVTEKEGANG